MKFFQCSRPRPLPAAVLAVVLLCSCGSQSPQAMLSSGKAALAKGDLKTASIQIRNALQSDPNLAEARYVFALILLQETNVRSAEAELRKALSLHYPEDLVVPKLATALILEGKYKEVIEAPWRDAKVTSVESIAELEVAKSKAFSLSGDAQSAAKSLAKAMAALPDYLPAQVLQAQQAAGRNDFDGALTLVSGILQRHSTSAEAWQLKGDVLRYGLRQVDAAATAYESGIAASPQYVPLYVSILELFLAKNDLEAARLRLDQLKKLRPNSFAALYFDAQYAYRRHDAKASAELAQQLIRLAPESPIALQIAGAIELQNNSLALAEKHLTMALQAFPQSQTTRQLLIRTHLRNGQSEKALVVLNGAKEGGVIPASLSSSAGEVYLQRGDNAKAAEFFALAAKQDPNSVDKRTELALARLAGGEVNAAISQLSDIAAADGGLTSGMALVSAYRAQKQLPKALEALDALEKKRPNEPWVHQVRGDIRLETGERRAARDSYEKALKLSPQYFAAAEKLAVLDMDETGPASARKRLEAFIQQNPQHGRAMAELAKVVFLSDGATPEVMGLLDKAIAADPTSPGPRVVLINFFLAKKDFKQASASAQKAVAAFPDNVEILDLVGVTQTAAGDLNQALATYSQLVTAYPRWLKPLLRKADVQFAAKDKAGARATLQRALALQPGSIEAQRGLVNLELADANFEGALALVRKMRQQLPKDSESYLLEGRIRTAQKDQNGALSAYRAGFTSTQTADLAAALHAALLASGRRTEANDVAAGWQKSHPDDAGFSFYMADVALQGSDFVAAEKNYRNVVRVQPKNAAAYNNLAWITSRSNPQAALQLAAKANELAPNSPSYMDTYAMILAETGDFKRAIEVQRKVVELDTADALFKLNLAKIYVRAGEKSMARDELVALSRLGEKFPAHAEVSSLIKSL